MTDSDGSERQEGGPSGEGIEAAPEAEAPEPSSRDRRAGFHEKVASLRESGIEPFERRYQTRQPISAIVGRYDSLDAGQETQDRYRIAGRVMARREHGKAAFLTLRDGGLDLQLFANVNTLGQESFDRFSGLDLGDIIGCDGRVFRTRRGELSLWVESWTLLTKAMRQPPEKWHGLQDVQTRYRQRYADLIANPEVADAFRLRSRLVSSMRRYLEGLGFMEVETPMLQPLPGGALARPFVTHHNALDTDLYLRIAPELYLKRLLVGGFERVFEIGKSFRNEGISPIHNPEFTMLELYWAYVDYREIMELVEEMVYTLARDVLGGHVIEARGRTWDLTPPWPRYSVDDLLREHLEMPLADVRADVNAASAALRRRGVDVEQRETFALLVDKTLKQLVWPTFDSPAFVIDHPIELSPLAKAHPGDQHLVERFQPVLAGWEIGNAFSELNDPLDQRRRFEQQVANKALGDEEAHAFDEDFLRALEYGMPPAGGLGIGVDRLVMLFLGVDSIRDAVLFPQLRPETF